MAGRLAHRQGDYAATGSILEQSLVLARQLALKPVIVLSIYWLGRAAGHLGEYRRAIALCEESVSLSREVMPSLTGVLLISLSNLYWLVGDYARSWDVLEDGISLARNQVEPAHRTVGLAAAGVLAWFRGHYAEAMRSNEEAILVFRQLAQGRKGSPPAIAWRLTDLGRQARETGDYVTATARHEEAERIYRDVGDKSMFAETFLERALVERDQGHLDRAEELLQQSLSLYEDVRMAAACLRELGEVARCRKDHGTAGRLIAESLATFRRLEDRPDTGRTLLVMARLAHGMGHHERAAALLKEALALWTGGMTRLERVRWLEAFAAVSPHVGAAEQGARLLGAAAHARAEMGTPLPPVERGWYDRVRVSLASALGQERLKTLQENGQAVTVEEAIESLRA